MSRYRVKNLIPIVFLLSLGTKTFAQQKNSNPGTANTAEVIAPKEWPPFRLHLNIEPVSLKPWEQKNSSAGYLLSQLNGTLLKYSQNKLTPSLAKSCEYKTKKTVECRIKDDASFSDGTPITAAHFKDTWLEFLKPENRSQHPELLFAIEGAKDYYIGKKPISAVKIFATKDRLTIHLNNASQEFLYNLANPLLAPLKNFQFPELKDSQNWVSSGAFKVVAWVPQKKITLESRKNKNLKVEFVFVSEDSTALNLYEKGELSFLRRLPTVFIAKYKTRPDFYQIPQNRMDYFGLAGELKNSPEIREALTKSLNYDEITQLLASKGQFGCPGISTELQLQVPCFRQDLEGARQALQRHRNLHAGIPKLKLVYSKQGGDDHKMVAEWMQSQWKSHLSLDVEISSKENKLFLEELKTNPPALFRKGLNPERPTCLAALENFEPANPENFLQINDGDNKKFLETLAELKTATDSVKSKKLCSQAVAELTNGSWWIPTGPIHFTVLAKPEWTGWTLNELNQLELENLILKH